MKKTITTIMLGILMLSGALAMYAGDSMTFETNFTNPVYVVHGNQSNLEGLNIIFENNNITISTALNYKPDNFSITIFDNTTKEIIKEINIGGGTRTRYIDNNITIYVPEYIEKIVNITIPTDSNNEPHHDPIVEESPDYSKIISFIFGLIVMGLISYVIYEIKKSKNNN